MTDSISRIFGKFANTSFPSFIQCFINKSYVKMMDIDMQEYIPEDPCKYETLNQLFIRHKKKIEFHEGENVLVSPSDSLITAHGVIDNDIALQIKGKEYLVSELIDKKIDTGYFVNLYLSPSDYHRYHVPIDMKVISATHIPGKLLPVNEPSLKKNDKLFVKNERVVLECESKGHIFYFVAVGALNVGKIFFNFDERINTNAKATQKTKYQYKDLYLKKGEELGRFEMGSTIVLIFEDDHFKYLNLNEKVEVGNILGEIF